MPQTLKLLIYKPFQTRGFNDTLSEAEGMPTDCSSLQLQKRTMKTRISQKRQFSERYSSRTGHLTITVRVVVCEKQAYKYIL